MSTITLSRARVARTISGNSPQVMTYPEAAAQTFKKGEFVYLVDGKVTEVGDDPTIILGMADQDASGTTDTAIAVVIANEDNIFSLHKVSETGGSGGAGTGAATAVTDVGKCANIYRDTTNNMSHAGMYAFGGNERLMILDISGFDTVGDIGGRLLCIVYGKYHQLFSTLN